MNREAESHGKGIDYGAAPPCRAGIASRTGTSGRLFENLGGKTLEEALADADAVLVRISELRGELLKDAKHLKVISKHGVGVDNIDLDYCRGAGIAVTIAPNGNSLSVAEHALTMMLALSKKLIPITNAYREIGFSAKNTMEGPSSPEKRSELSALGGSGAILPAW